MCATAISEELAPILERRKLYEADPVLVRSILLEGENKARAIAKETMQEVRAAMQLGEQ
jgi:tryptophanyl-tRNA synthetase